ncbi:MAG: NAD(P)-dependent oxidoreductase [Alphaproteobacteria bacterium]|nr:NAD(P)-dependent oxidoreductase [Alphaproteobacteria bacterium]
MNDESPGLGYIGMGLMGQPMTARLLAAGYPVTVWNRSAEKTQAAVEKGAVAAASPAAVAAASEIVFACVTDADAVEAVLFGNGGVGEAWGTGKIFVDHSSIHPDTTVALAARLEAQNGMRWIDAPISGGTKGAEEGTLAIMAGGAESDFAHVAPILRHTSARATLMGPVGAGQTTKLCNQMIAGAAFVTIAEALRFATNAGIDASRLMEALKGGFADSLPFQILGPRMLREIDAPLGHNDTILKDVETALEIGGRVAAPMPMTAAAAQLYRLMVARGHAKDEPGILYKLYGGSEKGGA